MKKTTKAPKKVEVKKVAPTKPTTILTFHSPDVPMKKRATVVGIVEGNQINIGVSVCSLKDTFEKKLGRTIAMGRASKEKSRFCAIAVTKDKQKEMFYSFASKITELV